MEKTKKISIAMLILPLILLCSTEIRAQDEPTSQIKKMSKLEFRKQIWNPQKDKRFTYYGSKPVIIDFNADWCMPCKKLAPILEKLQAEYGDSLQIYSIDIDREANQKPDYAEVFRFQTIPTLLFIKPGQKEKPVPFRVGGKTEEELRGMINEMLFK